MDAVDRFNLALQTRDLGLLESVLHPDFEMIVPQRPSRGFVGRDQEVENIRGLLGSCADLEVDVLRKVVDGDEVWVETRAAGTGVEVATVVIWELEPGTCADWLRQ